MSRIKRGWALSKKSWGLLNEHRALIRFPLYGAVATIRSPSSSSAPASTSSTTATLAGAIPLLVIGLYVLSVVGIYFAVGLAAAADMIFRGEEATVGDGLAVARSRFSQICGWAALSTAIGVFMGAAGKPGRHRAATIAARFVGMAWSLVTFIAVPVIAIEGTGAFATLKRSGGALPRALGTADHRQHRDRRRRLPARHAAERDPGRDRHRDLGLGQLRRRPAGRPRRDRLRAISMLITQRAQRHLRRRALPLCARRRGGGRLHRRGAGVGGQAPKAAAATRRRRRRPAPSDSSLPACRARSPQPDQALRQDRRRRRPLLLGRGRPGDRLPRPQRRRQDDDDAGPAGPGAAEPRRGTGRGAAAGGDDRAAAHDRRRARGDRLPPRPQRPQPPAGARRLGRHPRARGSRRCWRWSS